MYIDNNVYMMMSGEFNKKVQDWKQKEMMMRWLVKCQCYSNNKLKLCYLHHRLIFYAYVSVTIPWLISRVSLPMKLISSETFIYSIYLLILNIIYLSK